MFRNSGSKLEPIPLEDFADYLVDVISEFETQPPSSLLEGLRDELRQGIREGFNSSSDPETGAGWPPRKRAGDGHPILINKGSLLQAATGGGAGSVGRIGTGEVTIGVSDASVGYAKFHQHGTSKMPPRPFMGASEKTLSTCGELIAESYLGIF